MIFRANSSVVRALLWLSNPTYLLPQLFPLHIYQARVGTNTTDFVRVSFGKP